MARRLNWEKAKRRDRQRLSKLRASAKRAKARQRQVDSLRQAAIQAFVDKHSIECFVRGTREARWAKNDINKRDRGSSAYRALHETDPRRASRKRQRSSTRSAI
jgi:hypothetical protein